jgi:hypothetical protein
MTNDYIARSANRARYLCAGQSHLHRAPFRAGRKPEALGSFADLDFMDRKNPLFTYDVALYSPGAGVGAGNERLPKGVFSRREGSTILTDSGGYQYARDITGAKWKGEISQRWSLRFAEENGDESIALDIPTLAIGFNPRFPTFQACLDQTLENARYWMAHRRTDTRFLAVLQGRDRAEAMMWLEAAKLHPMEGWSFGGVMRTNYVHLLEVLLDLRASGLLTPERNRVHVLGNSTLVQAVMLSAIQRTMRELLQDDQFLITFDTASPSLLAVYGFAYGHARLNRHEFSMAEFKPPSLHDNGEDETPFPIRTSALADRLRIKDFIDPSPVRQNGTDSLGNILTVHHNTEALLRGIDEANSVMELPHGWKDDLAPAHIIAAYEALASAHQYRRDPIAHLRQSAGAFAGAKSFASEQGQGDGEGAA